jgi:hypothetical protein
MAPTPPSPRTEPGPPARTSALTLATALLLAVSGLFALPEAFFSEAYYTNTWATVAFAAPLLTVTTLVLAAAAVARGSRTFLLLVSAGTLLHLVGLVWLGVPASGSFPTADGPNLWSGPAQLGLALLALAIAWWITARTERRPWVPLALVAVAPLLGRFAGASPYWDWSWWPVLIAALGIPAMLTILAAGLVCLPDRAPQVAGAVLIVLAGLGVHGSDLVLGRQPHPYQLAVMGLALVCAIAGIVARRGTAADVAGPPTAHAADAEAGPGPDGTDQPDHGAPPASASGADREVSTMSDTAVVVVPSSHLETSPDTSGDPAGTSGRTAALPVIALVVLVLTAALRVPEVFAHGPGIQPDGLGLSPLLGTLSIASVPAAFLLTAGAATLASRGMLVVASAWSVLLVLVLLVSWTETGWAVAPPGPLSYVALGVALALAWTGRTRPGSGGVALRWAAVAPLVLASLPLSMLLDPNAMAFISASVFLTGFLLPNLLFFAAPVVAAALLGFPRRSAYVAAAVLLGVAAIAAVGMTLSEASGLRLLTALNVLQVGGYGLACVLVLAAVLPPGRARASG